MSLSSLRSLSLGSDSDVGVTFLAALGIAAFTQAFAQGCRLRSRCYLVPERHDIWEALSGPDAVSLGRNFPGCDFLSLLEESISALKKSSSLVWNNQLEPSRQPSTKARRRRHSVNRSPDLPGITVEFVAGVAHLDRQAYDEPGHVEWPPHPDRLFMALVAATIAASRQPAELEASMLARRPTPTDNYPPLPPDDRRT